MIEIRRYTDNPVEGLTVARQDGERRKIRGVASVYYSGQPGTEYALADGLVERIAPGAFQGLTSGDVIACINHDPSSIVARTPVSLKLFETARGLEYEFEVPPTTTGNDLWENVSRGLIRGSSFKASLNLNDDSQVEWTRDGKVDVLVIKRFANLRDVSMVTDPAYKATDCQAVQRSLETHKAMEQTLLRLARLKALGLS